MQAGQDTAARYADEQNWTIRIWSSVSVPNVKEITNIVRIICLRINMYTEVKGADTGSSPCRELPVFAMTAEKRQRKVRSVSVYRWRPD